LAETAAVFAKVSPSKKAAIIDALHRNGHVVGFLGDEINDGPALKAADVGISVDSAVDIAKETADIILLEKSRRFSVKVYSKAGRFSATSSSWRGLRYRFPRLALSWGSCGFHRATGWRSL
jgi:P-type E1-E2 ATPase